MLNFLRAADTLFWKKEKPGFIRKTIGVQALFDVLRELLPEQLKTKDLTEAAWKRVLAPAEHIDFTDNLFYASGGGRVRVRDALLIAIGHKKLEAIDLDRRAEFARVTRAKQ